MGTSYRHDDDLAFLEYCSEDDLEQLAKLIIYDGKGKKRVTTQILSEKSFQSLHGSPDQWRKSWQLVAGELQHFGGDTIINLFRREGVLYREILNDTCKRTGIKFDKKSASWEVEKKLIKHVIDKLLENMSEEERNEALKSMKFDEFAGGTLSWRSPSLSIFFGGAVAGARYAWAASAAKAAFAPLLFNRAAIAGASSLLAKRGSTIFLHPVAVIALTVPAVSGAAFRVTVPATIQIAYMREKYMNKDRFE